MPVHNEDIAAIFDELADLLELQQANPFRVRAYRRAAQTVRAQPHELPERLERGEPLPKMPGIGDELEAKIREIAETGHCRALEALQKKVPHGLEELLHLPGLGPARVRALRESLRITGPEALRAAIAAGRVRTIRGFGPKLEGRLAAALANPVTGERMLRATAAGYARSLLEHLRRHGGPVGEMAVAGSFRRGRETVGDLDLLVASSQPAIVMQAFTGYDEVREVMAAGDTKASVRLACGLQVDLRIVPGASFGAALQYFTGSKAHTIHLRRLGQRRGLKFNEYGVFRGERRVAGETEESVYAAVRLPWIPPELREDTGEIEAAARRVLPALVERGDLRGDLHVHTSASDGQATLEQMVAAARRSGLSYIACADHSRYLGAYRGLDARRLRQQLEAIDRLNARSSRFKVLKAIEVDILEDGSLALPDDLLRDLDLVVGAVHSHFGLTRRRQTARILRAIDHPCFTILAHPSGRLINEREPLNVDIGRIVSGCADRGCHLELNAQPRRLDLDDVGCRLAAEHGVRISIASDAHCPGDFADLDGGVMQARRGWLGAADVLNTLPLSKLRPLLQRTMA